LYKLIFKSLFPYNADTSIKSGLSELITRSKILYNKALYKQYFSTIDYAIKLARRYERWNFYLQLLEMKTNIGLLENLELLRDEMNKLKNVPFEKNAFLFFDFVNLAEGIIGTLKNRK